MFQLTYNATTSMINRNFSMKIRVGETFCNTHRSKRPFVLLSIICFIVTRIHIIYERCDEILVKMVTFRH